MAKNEDFLLTTFDNPFDPFTQFDDWNRYDTDTGYCTWQRLDKLMPKNYLRMSSGERNHYLSKAMNELVTVLPNIYKVVSKTDTTEVSE